MRNILLIIVLCALMLLTSCTTIDDNPPVQYTDNTSPKSVGSINIGEVIEKKKSELDESDAPYGVSEIYTGTMFDYNNDGINDYTILYSMYMQFVFSVVDGENAELLLEERIIIPFDLNNLTTEIYVNNNNEYVIKNIGRTVPTASSALIETIQFTAPSDTLILEAVYDKHTTEFVHAYDKFTYEEYLKKQYDFLDGYKLYLAIEWDYYHS